MKRKLQSLIMAAQYKNNHASESLTEIAIKFHVDRHALSKTLHESLDYPIIKDGYCYYFDEHEKKAIDYFINNPNISFVELKRKFQLFIKDSTFAHWFSILNIPYNQHHKYNYNRNAFSQIATEEDAYWLGFITADGYINEDKHILNIGLGKKDVEHLKKIFMLFTI